jgi:hypothetical protein
VRARTPSCLGRVPGHVVGPPAPPPPLYIESPRPPSRLPPDPAQIFFRPPITFWELSPS